jgi:hypothetical protein
MKKKERLQDLVVDGRKVFKWMLKNRMGKYAQDNE